jgi:Zn ribbon nucleic-acid-binding protein
MFVTNNPFPQGAFCPRCKNTDLDKMDYVTLPDLIRSSGALSKVSGIRCLVCGHEERKPNAK